jgi:hypothetical protein
MTFATNDTTRQSLEQFRGFDVDTQLALLWYGYLDIKDQLNPTSQPSVQDVAQALFDQIQALPQPEQLQAQRDIAGGADNSITRAYSSLSSSGKLDVWLLLAQGMEQGTIIQVPDDYSLPAQTGEFTQKITSLDFEDRINFMRSAVIEMGAKS